MTRPELLRQSLSPPRGLIVCLVLGAFGWCVLFGVGACAYTRLVGCDGP